MIKCKTTLAITLAFLSGLAAAAAILLVLAGPTPVRAGPGILYVAPGGTDGVNDCADNANPCATVQHAIDAGAPGDEIRVATGIYTDVHIRSRNDFTTTGVVTQVVYISKSVTIRGGYTTTNWNAPNPIFYPTTLDARGRGRVMYITGDISPTVEGLHLTGGDATGLGGAPWEGYYENAGGGVYIITATATISNCQIFSNTATSYGGGLSVYNSAATLDGNTISDNFVYHYGGGLFLQDSTATIISNTIKTNTSSKGWGGGLSLWDTAATISDNAVISNAADFGGGLYLEGGNAAISDNAVIFNAAGDSGGGLFLKYSNATISGNIFISNAAYHGGGLCLLFSDVMLIHNTLTANIANGRGGGLYLSSNSKATLSNNTMTNNTADDGGGLYLSGGDAATIGGNAVISNAADNGGGLYLSSSDATLTNNVVADNQAAILGSGLYIRASSPRLLHTTVARNRGSDGIGVYVTGSGSYYSSVALTNTILVSHTVGITVTTGNTATLEATLWGTDTWANAADWGGAGIVITGELVYNTWGDPDFVDPDVKDYHIGPVSRAIDAGVDTDVTTDMDGQTRPDGCLSDIGADEFFTGIACGQMYLPLVLSQYPQEEEKNDRTSP